MARQLSGMRAAAYTAVAAAAILAGTGCAQEEHSEFIEVVEVLQEDFIDRDKLSATEMERAGIEGLLEYLDDPYTSYLDPRALCGVQPLARRRPPRLRGHRRERY